MGWICTKIKKCCLKLRAINTNYKKRVKMSKCLKNFYDSVISPETILYMYLFVWNIVFVKANLHFKEIIYKK
jgi:hypothetical protein